MGVGAQEAELSRRELLGNGLKGLAGLALGHTALASGGELTPAASSTKRLATAKAVIQIWMWGGPSHLDTFDPKPEAGADYCGPFRSPIPTNVDGIRVCELLPLLAQQADKYSIVRSMTHGINSHETASYLVQTGHMPSRIVFPCAGAVVSLLRGYSDGYAGVVAPYIVLTQSQGRFSESGFLGQQYKPFVTGGDPNSRVFAVEGIVAQGLSDKRQRGRRKLLRSLDSLGRAIPNDADFALFDECEANAYAMMFGEAREIFDLSREEDELRDRYGRNTFGQSCLMARRLVESGVPYVTINYRGWDTHKQHFQTMKRKLPEMDRGMATLLADLSERNLLESTVIWWGGEFGRTPRIQWEPPWNGGRGHFGACFSSVLAGGGFRGGRVVGASDARGLEVADRPVHPSELLAAIYQRLGISHDEVIPNHAGVEARILTLRGDLCHSGSCLPEITC